MNTPRRTDIAHGLRSRRASRSPARIATAVVLALALSATACSSSSSDDATTQVSVFAAASLRDVLIDVGDAFRSETGMTVVPNFAASNALAQQIRASNRADVFLSASDQWIEYLEEADRLDAGTRTRFLSNQLVVIVRDDSTLELDSPRSLADATYRYLSIGDPEAVPAGRYARAWLESIDHGDASLWQAVAERIAPATNVRAALSTVEGDRDIVGIVYRTDALASERVRVAFEVPVETGPDIGYTAARTTGGPNPAGADRFIAFLDSDTARKIFIDHGFRASSNKATTDHGDAPSDGE